MVHQHRLEDACFYISVHPLSRKYLGFFFRGHAYQYGVLPFGYALAPRTFSLVLQAALEPLLRKGIVVRFYLDDLLVQSSSKAQAMLDTQAVVHHLSSLGFSVNVEKSSFLPLHPGLVSQIWSLFGQASVDLFATGRYTRCPLWFSGHSGPTLSLGVDAFRHSPWPPGLLYVFPSSASHSAASTQSAQRGAQGDRGGTRRSRSPMVSVAGPSGCVPPMASASAFRRTVSGGGPHPPPSHPPRVPSGGLVDARLRWEARGFPPPLCRLHYVGGLGPLYPGLLCSQVALFQVLVQ